MNALQIVAALSLATVLVEAQTVMQCNDRTKFDGSSVLIQSPNKLNGETVYEPRTKCKYRVKVPAGTTLTFDFFEMDVMGNSRCKGDFVKISTRDKSLNEKFCGEETTQFEHFFDEATTLTVLFKSNGNSVVGEGFSLEIRDGSTPGPSTEEPGTTAEPGTTPEPTTPGPFQCGIADVNSRIVGGDEVNRHSIPWQVAITTRGGFFFCGGSIIGPKAILTAAHCIEGDSPNQIRVVVGEHDKNNETDGTVHTVECIKPHPNYDRYTLDSDYAVLILKKEIDLGPDSKARAVCLADTKPEVSTIATVSGWGTLYAGGFSPDVLHSVDVPIVSHEDCNDSYDGDITDNMICAGLAEGGIDSCQGDSGGPLTALTAAGVVEQVGVVSWGIGCAYSGYPGVYATVSTQLDWINSFNPTSANPTCG